MEETKRKLYVERDGFWTEAAMLLMALAMVFRLIGSIGRWEDMHYMTTQVALPIVSGLLYLLCLLLFGKRAFWTTVIPVVAGLVFFIFRIMGLESEWLKVGWIAFYLVIVVLYAMCFSHPGLKWALAAVLLLTLAYHIGILDLPKLLDLENPVSFVDGMEEMSILGVILSMLFLSLSMKTTVKTAAAEEAIAPEEEIPEPIEPEEPREKKLSRRERRKLEREKKEAAAKAETPKEPEKPEALLEMRQEVEKREEIATVPVPAPTEPEPAPEVPPVWQEPEEAPAPWQVPEEPETIPEEVPVEELELPGEPAEVYPVEEPAEAPEIQGPDAGDTPESP